MPAAMARAARRAIGLLALAWLAAAPVRAADVVVMISAAYFPVYSELGPAFEKATGHRLVTTRGPSMGDSPEAIPNRLARGEAADALILDRGAAEQLVAQGQARADSLRVLARSLIGMVVKAGATKPDIGSVEAFRQTLVDAKSVAYSDSASGVYLSTTLFPQLGLAGPLAPQPAGKSRKVRGPPSGEPVAAVVARGEAELGFQQVSEVLHVPGVQFVGPIPGSLQPEVYFAGAVTSSARQPEAAAALLRFLTDPAAVPVLQQAGLVPLKAP